MHILFHLVTFLLHLLTVAFLIALILAGLIIAINKFDHWWCRRNYKNYLSALESNGYRQPDVSVHFDSQGFPIQLHNKYSND